MNYAEIVFPIPLDRVFHYVIPDTFPQGAIKVGARVKVNFGRYPKIGYCVGLSQSLPPDMGMDIALKAIEQVIDPEPLLTPEIVMLCRWIADYYFCSWGQALDSALPAGVRRIKKTAAVRKSKAVIIDPYYEEVERAGPLTFNDHQEKAYNES